MREKIQYEAFIKKAKSLAEAWELSVTKINVENEGSKYPVPKGQEEEFILDQVRQIRLSSAMEILLRYNTVLPPE